MNPNDPIYPTEWEVVDEQGRSIIGTDKTGLTIRQEFAARAMQGLLAAKDTVIAESAVGRMSVAYADALITALGNGPNLHAPSFWGEGDRFYHAKDNTWWRYDPEKGLVEAEVPAKLQEAALQEEEG